jgi:hypothetical protein
MGANPGPFLYPFKAIRTGSRVGRIAPENNVADYENGYYEEYSDDHVSIKSIKLKGKQNTGPWTPI